MCIKVKLLHVFICIASNYSLVPRTFVFACERVELTGCKGGHSVFFLILKVALLIGDPFKEEWPCFNLERNKLAHETRYDFVPQAT